MPVSPFSERNASSTACSVGGQQVQKIDLVRVVSTALVEPRAPSTKCMSHLNLTPCDPYYDPARFALAGTVLLSGFFVSSTPIAGKGFSDASDISRHDPPSFSDLTQVTSAARCAHRTQAPGFTCRMGSSLTQPWRACLSRPSRPRGHRSGLVRSECTSPEVIEAASVARSGNCRAASREKLRCGPPTCANAEHARAARSSCTRLRSPCSVRRISGDPCREARAKSSRRGSSAAVSSPRSPPAASFNTNIVLRHRLQQTTRTVSRRARISRDRDADPHQADARRRARLSGAEQGACGRVLCAAAVAAAVQAAAHGVGLRSVFPDRAMLSRRRSARRPSAGVYADRHRGFVHCAGRHLWR